MTGPAAVELELFRHLLVSVPEEMGVVLRKTSYSANIKERRDYSCAIYDSAGEAVAMGDHMPVHLGAMPLAVQAVRHLFRLGPGDVAIVNDPFAGGTHLPDITAVAGACFDSAGRPAFYVANRAHHADVGGMSPGSMPLAREIYQEGLRIPPVLLVRRGEPDRDLWRVVLANVRTPEERAGDLEAQWMALRRGQQRLEDLARRFGVGRIQRNMQALKDYSERIMRRTLGQLPPGTYRFEDRLDDDGVSLRPVRIAVAVTIQGGEATVDFSGSDPQAEGPVNANYAVTVAAVMYVFRCLAGPDVPYTAGLMRPIRVVAPEGTVVNARLPAAMAAGNVETSQRITDALLGALAQAAPERIPAASSGTMNNLSLGGWDPFRGRAFAYYETVAGGMGASAAAPGHSAVHTHMTNSWNTPVEALEHQFPLRIRAYRIRPNSGGIGRRRGGDGIVREIEFLAPCEVTILSDRRRSGPYGLCGGGSGRAGRNVLVRSGKSLVLRGKVKLQTRAGDLLRIETPGGGGYGSA
ncbi:MAG: hydantoinase B/oxoprolinase family protein [Bryobacterales bacterium]|nr:hydantoinase B/oxoprolinase family protein [Bryobacteraceae bacterium]MDW8354697.1 hydantoinase B/oxoprolinase family protein [Bryobacterales bacterium]